MEDASAAVRVVRSYPFGPLNGLEIDPTYFWLQEHEPLARVKLPYGDEGWLLTRYDDVRTANSDPRFSLAQAVVRDVPRLNPERTGTILTDLDPPEHTRLRRLVAKAFTVRRVEQLRGQAEQTAAGLLNELVQAGPPADLVQSFAVPLPGLMICELLGVPYADRDEFQEWVAAFMVVTALTVEERSSRLGKLAAYLAGLAAQRRETPTQDLLGALVAASEEGDRLTDDELIQLVLLLLGAGYDTTASEIANFTYALLTHPDQLALLREQPELIPNAVEELLRWTPLLATADALPRYALDDVQLSSGTVPAGDPVLLARHVANHDRRMFPIPTASTSPGSCRATRRSDTAPTTASAPRWPAWTSRSPWPPCSTTSPACGWPFPPTSCNGRPARRSAARSPCRSAGERHPPVADGRSSRVQTHARAAQPNEFLAAAVGGRWPSQASARVLFDAGIGAVEEGT